MITCYLLGSTVVFLALAAIGAFYVFMGWCQWTEPDPSGGDQILLAVAVIFTLIFATFAASGVAASVAHFFGQS